MRVRSYVMPLAVGAVLGAFCAVAVVDVAQAYQPQNCTFAVGTINPISWRYFSVSSTYTAASNHGFTSWNATSSPGYFDEQSTSLDPEVNVTDDAYTNSGNYAWWSYACNTGHYSGNEGNFVWDTTESASRTTAQRKRIAVHELGHAYGLAHVGAGSSHGCRIMRTDVGYMTDCTITAPTADDINGANAYN